MDCKTAEYIVAFVSAPESEAPKLARAVVEEKLAACANILPQVRSIYRWKGKVCDEGESLLVIKTRAALAEKLSQRIAALHSYEVCEVICLPILAGNPPYLSWIAKETAALKK